MPEDKNFSDSAAPKKSRRVRKVVVTDETPENVNNQKIDRQLKDIYEDDNGHLPDMREIKRASSGSFIAGLFKFFFSIALVAALAWAGFLFLPNAGRFDDSQVDLKIQGPQNFSVGATTTYDIVFKNNQGVNLNKVTLTLNYPAGFSYLSSSLEPKNMGKNEWEIGTLKPHEEKTVQITGNSYGSVGTAISWRALLNYTPENFNSEMQKVATLDIKPDQAPISVAISGLDKVAIGSPSNYTITIKSQDNLANKNVTVSPIFPANFVLTTSSLPLEKNVWNIKASSSTAANQYTIAFSGQFNDSTADASDLKVQVSMADQEANAHYLLAESTLKTELIKNAVIINTAINGSLTDFDSKPGEILNFTVAVKNAGKEDISKAKVQIVVDAPSFKKQSVLSWSDIADKHDGNISGSQISDSIRRASITWDSTKDSELALIKSNAQSNLEFQLPIKNSDQAPWSSVDNYQISVTTTLTYTDKTGATQTITGNSIIINLNSDLALKQKNDISSDSQEREKHDITWILSNTFHTLKNVTVSADLFGDITFASASSTPAGTLSFDPASKHLTWNIPELTENSDVLALPFSVTINKKNPTQNILISKVHLQAQDAVTGKQLEITGNEVSLK
ncbi:MAG: hypothetical protein NT034_00405 [Candidatus Magasanikbacteria bacterium]|nr:hypothetical protein [Candidatus Magasanikbacteria bacterium]